MDPIAALLAYTAAAALLTVTPGLDTALILRTSAVEGRGPAVAAGAGICLGLLVWGGAVAVGLGALLAASETAYEALRWAGAAYLVWLGLTLLLRPRRTLDLAAASQPGRSGRRWFWRGLLSNLLNPKIGVFYVSFLPQFVPAEVAAAPWIFGLAVLHVLLTLVWFAALIALTVPLGRALRRPAILGWLDRVTGGLFIAFGAALALSRR